MANGNGHHDDAPPGALMRNGAGADLDVPPPTLRTRTPPPRDIEPPPARPTSSARLRAAPPARGDLRIGIIGTGGMAAAHAENFLKQPGCSLAACLDIDAEAARGFANRFRVAAVARDVADLLERCDAVAIVTPDASHAAYAIAALRSNRHVLCEKPLTSTLAEARAVAKEAAGARERGVIGMVNFSYRCAAAVHHAAWMRQNGAIGEIRHLAAQYFQGWLCDVHEPTPGQLWRLRSASGGGVLADLGCHLIDMVGVVAGDFRRVQCTTMNFPKVGPDGTPFKRWQGKALDADDTAVIHAEFAGGGLGVLQVSRWASGRQNTIRVDAHGTRGALVFDLDHSYDQVHHHDAAAKRWQTHQPAPAPSGWQRFIEAIRGGRHDQPDLQRGAQVQAVLEACRRSAERGGWEDVEAL